MQCAPNVLTFPIRNKGRVRKTQSIEAGGELILNCLTMRGVVEPDNIARIRALPEPSPIDRSPEMLLAVSIWAAIPADRQDDVRTQLRYLASAERCPHALAVLRLLGGAM